MTEDRFAVIRQRDAKVVSLLVTVYRSPWRVFRNRRMLREVHRLLDENQADLAAMSSNEKKRDQR